MLAAGAFALFHASAAAAAPVLAAATDLRAEARLAAKRGEPLVLLFSLPDCRYCAVVRQNYLAPLARAAHPGGPMVVRELGLIETAVIGGFGGDKTSGSALAARYGIHAAPTVVMVGIDGKLLAPPLVGGDVAGMYGAYLDGALEQARAAVPASAAASNTH